MSVKTELLQNVVAALGNTVDSETFKAAGDAMLDEIENRIAASPTQFDDITLLPVINVARQVLNIPDNDEPEPATVPGSPEAA